MEVFFFEDDTGEKVPTKNIEVKGYNDTIALRYQSPIIFVKTNEIEEYLISISLWLGDTEYYDFINNKVSFVNTIEFSNYNVYSTISTLMEIDNGNTKEYLHTFIGQNKDDQSYQSFYLISQKYIFTKNNISLNDGYTIQQKINKPSSMVRTVSNFKTDSNIFIYFYLYEDKYIIETYNNEFAFLANYEITGITLDEKLFCKGIYMYDNLGVFTFYEDIDSNGPQMRLIEINNNGLSFTDKYILPLNSPGYFSSDGQLNDLIKINNNRFCLISSSKDKKNLYILLFDLYNDNFNIKERIYSIKSFDLYNYMVYKEVTSIIYNNYLTLSVNVCNTYPCDETNDNFNYFPLIIIFGYVKGENKYMNISPFLSELNDVNGANGNNIIDYLLQSANIENNIFGYEYQKKIKLISILDELNFYNIENDEKIPVNEGEILNYNYEINQNDNIIKYGNKNYYFEFQYIAQEPEVDKFNEYAIEVKMLFSLDCPSLEDENFESKIFYGKTIKAEFKLCYELCDTCKYLGTLYSDQKCLSCIENYDLLNGNCYPIDIPVSTTQLNINNNINDDTENDISINTNKYDISDKDNSIDINPEDKIINDLYNNKIYKTDSDTNLTYINELITDIQNSIKNGKFDDLFNDYIKGEKKDLSVQINNILLKITSSENQNYNIYNKTSIKLGECENELKRQNDIDLNETLLIFMIEKYETGFNYPILEYEIYDPNEKANLNLDICNKKNMPIEILIPISINESESFKYNTSSEYYNDN